MARISANPRDPRLNGNFRVGVRSAAAYVRLRRANDLTSESPRFVLKRADCELGGGAAVAEILPDPLLKPAASFTLSDVHKIMQEQLTIAPGIGPNDHSMAKTYATRVVGDDAGASRGFRQLLFVRHRNSIDNQHSYFGTILDAGTVRVGHVPRA